MSFGLGLLGAGASQFSSMGGFGGIGGSASKYGASAAFQVKELLSGSEFSQQHRCLGKDMPEYTSTDPHAAN